MSVSFPRLPDHLPSTLPLGWLLTQRQFLFLLLVDEPLTAHFFWLENVRFVIFFQFYFFKGWTLHLWMASVFHPYPAQWMGWGLILSLWSHLLPVWCPPLLPPGRGVWFLPKVLTWKQCD
jgi:hypothetical protein